MLSRLRFSRASVSATALVLSVSGWLVLAGVPAQAAITHKYLSQLTGFGNPTAVAFDAAGDVYVVDTQARTVDRFTAAGAPLAFSESGSYIEGSKLKGTPTGPGGSLVAFTEPASVAVNDENGEVYVADSAAHVVDVFSSTGKYLSQLAGTPPEAPVAGPFVYPRGLTIDQSNHDLYVTVSGEGVRSTVVDVFSSTGTYVSQFGAGVLGGSLVESVVVNDLTETAYVADSGREVVDVFNSAGSFVPPVWGGASTPNRDFGGYEHLGLDQSNGHVYVTIYGSSAGGDVVDEFAASASEEYVGQVTGTPTGPGGESVPFSGPLAAAVDPASGDLYVADSSGVVDIFGPDIVVPDVTTGAASSVTETTATLEGVVDPDETSVTGCEFEYRIRGEASFVHTIACAQPLPLTGKAPVAISANLPGLVANTTYEYRLSATNANATNKGSVQSFPTSGPPTIDSESASVGSTRATLSAQINPDGFATHYHFEYGPTASYGTSVPIPDGEIPAGFSAQGVSANVSGLKPNTTYHFRVVASNEGGPTVDGPDQPFTTRPPVGIESETASNVRATSATLEAQINPLGSETSAYFQYGTVSCTASPASCTDVPIAPGTDLGSGESDQLLSEHLKGLIPGTTYYFRVIATNALGTVDGPDETFTTQPPVLIDSESVSNVAATSATLEAQVNPQGSETSAYFQYGTVSCTASPASCTDVPIAPGTDLGSEEGDQLLSEHLQGLTPDTTYYYRVIATNRFATLDGPDESFTTQPGGTSFVLPDNREWELVSPPSKYGAGLLPMNDPTSGALIQAAQEGGAMTYATAEPIEPNPPANRAPEDTQVLSIRKPGGGWETKDVLAPKGESGAVDLGDSEYEYFSSDLSLGLFTRRSAKALPPLPEGSQQTPYLRRNFGVVEYEPLLPTANTLPGAEYGVNNSLITAGVSPDLSYVVLASSRVPLTSGAVAGSLYEWSQGAPLKLVSVLPASEGGGPVAANLGARGKELTFRHAVSNDGSRIVWKATVDKAAHLYLRDMAREETVQVSPGGGEFQAASSDGSRVLFTEGGELYAFEVTSGPDEALAGKRVDLTGGKYVGFVGASEDGAYVYFGSEGDLYVESYNGTEWTPPRYIAAVEVETSRVSPNGRYLAFMSSQNLTGYDTRDTNSGEPDEEVFLYDDSGSGRLVCASCDPTGARPVGRNLDQDGSTKWVAADIPGLTEIGENVPGYLSRALSSDGRVFFDSVDPLVPADVSGSQNVYEYEPEGVGSCQGATAQAGDVFNAASGGCVALLSSGISAEESAFFDASEDGGEVFFSTSARLVPQDYDNAYDVYDARVCTSESPCLAPPPVVPPPCDTGDACKPAPTPQPTIFGAPSSETFSGAGNIVPSAAGPSVTRAKRSARAQKLAKALKVCRKKPRRKRAGCESGARKRYGARKSGAGKDSSVRAGR